MTRSKKEHGILSSNNRNQKREKRRNENVVRKEFGYSPISHIINAKVRMTFLTFL